MDLATFNELPPDAAAAVVRPCADVAGWVDDVVAGRPYERREDLLGWARRASEDWTAAELDTALAHHPRIGERATGPSPEATSSRREQPAADDATGAALATANAAYEARFGRVFLIRAAGRTAPEILAELERRLGNEPAAEEAEAVEQLRQIALLRLDSAVGAAPTASTHVLDAERGRPAAGLRVTLAATGPGGPDVRTAMTDDDGRVSWGAVRPGPWTLTFATGEWFAAQERATFYPRVVLDVEPGTGHHHVAVLLSAFAYTTYRGS